MEEMFKEKMLWTSQVYGHHDEMAQNITKHGVYKDATDIKK